MAVELASAWVSLVPSTKGIGAQVRREVQGPLEEAASAAGVAGGRGFGANLFANMRSGLDQVGGAIVGAVTRGAKVAAVAGAAVIGAGLFGGLQRALDREDAVITFRRMGLDEANIEQLTDSIDAALRGTPIANPEGFALAGRFLAQGFDEADIPDIVATIADMATVGNRSFGEMADVLVSAAGQGRITAAELNRMGDIPLNKVAQELDLAEDELREMVSSGELTAEAFIGAFAAVDEFSGAAKDPSTRVAFTNLKTAVSALGEQFLGPLLGEGGVAQQAMLSLREIVSDAGPMVARWGQAFSDWLIPAVSRLAELFTTHVVPAVQAVVAWFERNREVIGKVMDVLGPAALIVGGFATAVFLLGAAWGLIVAVTPVGIILALVAALVYAWQNSERFREIVTAAFQTIRAVVATVVTFVSEAWRGFVAGFNEGADTWTSGVGRATALIGDAMFRVVDFVRSAVAVALKIWDRFGSQIVRFITTSMSNVRRVISGVLNIIKGIWQAVTGLLTGDWRRFGEGIGRIAGGFLNVLRGLFSQAWNVITTLWRTAGRAILDLAREQFGRVVDFFRRIPQRLKDAFSNPGDLLKSIGRAIIDGLISGITGRVKGAIDAVKDAVSGVVDGAKSALGIGSPSRVFAEIGDDMMAGWIRGVEARHRDLLRTMGGTVDDLTDVAAVSPSVAAGRAHHLDVSRVLARPAAAQPETIQLVVDGQVLAEVNRNSNERWATRNRL